jgi:hypothetical protein
MGGWQLSMEEAIKIKAIKGVERWKEIFINSLAVIANKLKYKQ